MESMIRQATVIVIAGGQAGLPFELATTNGNWQAAAIINATGTWNNPILPAYPGQASFQGRQLHTRDYLRLEDFVGQRVAIVGGGISAVQQLEEISRVATTFWYTRREPVFRNTEFNQDCCAQAPQATDPLLGSSPQLPTPPRGRPVENK